jgi:ApaG domain
MALLATSQQKAAGERKPLKTVQLRSRRWRIRDSSGELVDDISGDGVISQFPVLSEGNPPAGLAAPYTPPGKAYRVMPQASWSTVSRVRASSGSIPS